MTADHFQDNAARLQFMQISEEGRRHLAEFWKLAEPRLDDMLDAFYGHAGGVPALARLIGNQRARLKSAQAAHWRRLFSGRFDAEYFAGVRAIGLAHNRIGLEPRWYIGGYNFVLNRLTELAADSYRWSPARLKGVLTALNAAVMLDMDVAISVYQEAMVTERTARGESLAQLMESFDEKAKAMLASVADAGAQLQTTAQSMSSLAAQTRGQSASVASASEETSVNVQAVAAAAEQLARSVTEILGRVTQSAEMADSAVHKAHGANETMQQLVENAGRISAVVQLIQAIAGQTNLLALNATIEAARAGEAGKGFAVVANEVKSLAGQTARATEEIARSVDEIQSATRNAGDAITAIGAAIEDVSQSASAIADGVRQQGEATKEIAHSVHEAAQGARDVAANIIGVSDAVDRSDDAARAVLDAADRLDRQSKSLHEEITGFVRMAKAM